MPRGNGGVIGPANIPAAGSAKGIWSLLEQFVAKQQGTWPFIGTVVVQTFTATSTWTCPTGVSEVEYLVVAGGGGGGGSYYHPGGGGAGGFSIGTTTVSANTDYTITVGGGGNGGAVANTHMGLRHKVNLHLLLVVQALVLLHPRVFQLMVEAQVKMTMALALLPPVMVEAEGVVAVTLRLPRQVVMVFISGLHLLVQLDKGITAGMVLWGQVTLGLAAVVEELLAAIKVAQPLQATEGLDFNRLLAELHLRPITLEVEAVGLYLAHEVPVD